MYSYLFGKNINGWNSVPVFPFAYLWTHLLFIFLCSDPLCWLENKQSHVTCHFDLQMAVSCVSLIKFQGNKCSQLCLTLCDPVDCSPPGSPVQRIFQARIPEWGAMPSSRGASWCRDQTCVSCIAGRFFSTGVSLVAQKVKRLPAVWETWVWSLGWEDPLEKEMAPHSSTLAWKIPRTEEPGRLQSMGSSKSWTWLREFTFFLSFFSTSATWEPPR